MLHVEFIRYSHSRALMRTNAFFVVEFDVMLAMDAVGNMRLAQMEEWLDYEDEEDAS